MKTTTKRLLLSLSWALAVLAACEKPKAPEGPSASHTNAVSSDATSAPAKAPATPASPPSAPPAAARVAAAQVVERLTARELYGLEPAKAIEHIAPLVSLDGKPDAQARWELVGAAPQKGVAAMKVDYHTADDGWAFGRATAALTPADGSLEAAQALYAEAVKAARAKLGKPAFERPGREEATTGWELEGYREVLVQLAPHAVARALGLPVSADAGSLLVLVTAGQAEGEGEQ